MMISLCRALAVGLLVPLLAGCGATSAATPGGPRRSVPPARREAIAWRAPIWLLAASHLRAVLANPGADSVLRSGTVLEPIGPHQHAVSFAISAVDFHSEALLARDIGSLDGVRVVIYDNERSTATPVSEQRDPYSASVDAAGVARTRGLVSICDLILPDRLPRTERAARFEVPPCDVIGLNTVQQSERSAVTYAAVVAREVAIIRSVQPDVPILAGLSANPRGAPVTASELTSDMLAVRGMVSGFWLNVPAPGVGCPSCRAPDPGLLAAALADLPKGFATRPVATSRASAVTSGSGLRSGARTETMGPGAKAVLVSSGALARMGVSDQSAVDLLHARLLVLGEPTPALVGATPVAYFRSATTAVQALDAGRVHARWLLLDLERWRFTPLSEQEAPVAAVRAVSVAARSHGVRLLVSLGSDLFRGGPSGLVSSGVLAPIAELADGYEVQVQSVEDATATYRIDVDAAVLALRHANPRIDVLAGLTSASRPHEPEPTAAQVTADVRATAEQVDGYWLNVPVAGGMACPRCGAGDPAVMASALRELA